MKIKCLVGCNGLGYEKFKVGEVREVKQSTAETLIGFGYATKEPEESDDKDGSQEDANVEEAKEPEEIKESEETKQPRKRKTKED